MKYIYLKSYGNNPFYGKAKEVLKKYLDSENFSILYEEQNGMWLPSKKFSILKFEKLDEVFDEINNK
jgi:hypothetical protein